MLSRLPQQFASKLVPVATLFSLLTISVKLYKLSCLFTIISTCFPPNLDLDGPIGGKIKKICGRPLQVELSQLKKINQIGEAVITNAYNMKCKKLILVADPKWQGGNCHEEENLERSYLNALELVDIFNVNGVAFPILSTGVYQFPKKRAIEIAIKTIKKFLRDGDLSVALVVYDTDSFEKYQKLFSKFTIVDGKLVDGKALPGCFMEIKRNRGGGMGEEQ